MKLRRRSTKQLYTVRGAVSITLGLNLSSGERDNINTNIVALFANILENMPVNCVRNILTYFEVVEEEE